jgi:hypothetical protein
MQIQIRRRRVAPYDHRRWLANVGAAAAADALVGDRRARLGGPPADEHVHLRAYLDRWRAEAGEFFG